MDLKLKFTMKKNLKNMDESRRELILKQKEEKREAYLKKRDSLLKLRRKK